MKKNILVTGATDGIGRETARMLAAHGHHMLLHGRNPAKLKELASALAAQNPGGRIATYLADLSRMAEVEAFAKAVAEKHTVLDVLINNAGVFRTQDRITPDGLDVRFAVNTFAPYVLTQRLLPLLGASARVVNLSSAAQATVDIETLAGRGTLSDGAAYAQSKLAITMWSRDMALSLEDGPMIVAVNPRSMLGTKMVKEAYGVSGGDRRIGADILCRASLSDEFADASGQYFDNDIGRFAPPHPDAMDPQKCKAVVHAMEAVLAQLKQ